MVELRPGQLVRSLAGRDRGKHYLVLQVIDQRYVLLVDGRSRTAGRPKKKNKVHLQHYDRGVETEQIREIESGSNNRAVELIKKMAPANDQPDEEV